MKRLLTLMVMMSLTGVVFANCGNDNGNGNGCSGQQGPKGDKGDTGPAGLNGSDGKDGQSIKGDAGQNGENGAAGKDGRNGTDAQVDRSAKLVLDTAVRLYDGKYVQLQAFNVYQLSRKHSQDVIGDGNNFMFGARVVFKLGRSYEERRLDELEKKLRTLGAR